MSWRPAALPWLRPVALHWWRPAALHWWRPAALLLLLLPGCPESSGPSFDAASDLNVESDGVLQELSLVTPVCPPEPPFGLQKGDRVEPLEFLDGMGNSVNLHSFCGSPLTLVYHFYGW